MSIENDQQIIILILLILPILLIKIHIQIQKLILILIIIIITETTIPRQNCAEMGIHYKGVQSEGGAVDGSSII